jgi:hypothetical protein
VAAHLAAEAAGLFQRVELRVEEAETFRAPVLHDQAPSPGQPTAADNPASDHQPRRRGKASAPGG